MEIRHLHGWNLTAAEAREIQRDLVGSIDISTPLTLQPGDLVAGVDNSYLSVASETISYAAAVVMTWPDFEVVEVRTATREVTFPYIPGLLTFRELPVLVKALEQVENAPALIFSDGHGIAHPRRIGIASHLGLLANTPTIGIAKKPFRTTWSQPDKETGATTPLFQGPEQVGYAVRTRASRKYPVFVSPGHLIRVENVLEPVLMATNGDFLPRPQQAAHNEVTRMRKVAKELAEDAEG